MFIYELPSGTTPAFAAGGGMIIRSIIALERIIRRIKMAIEKAGNSAQEGTVAKIGTTEMRDKIFHQYLYEEKLKHKEHRFSLITTKIIFIASLFGLSATSFAPSLERMYYLLILVPVLCFSTDIYIKAEDYKVKRIGKFIRTRLNKPEDGSKSEEKMWEDFLEEEIGASDAEGRKPDKRETMREMDSRKNSSRVTRIFCLSGLVLFVLFSATTSGVIESNHLQFDFGAIKSQIDGVFVLIYAIEILVLEFWNRTCEKHIEAKLNF
jgi:hypothetical protein